MLDQLFWRWLPKKRMSNWVGRFAKHPISRHLIPRYIKMFDIDVKPIKKPLDQFESLLDFFIRELQPEARPIDRSENVIVSPVDGTVSQIGMIEEGKLLQAKGVTYSLEQLLGNQKKYVDKFIGGNFVTIYLSPRDYHRIHMPVAGEIEELTYIPGELYPVNRVGVEKVPGLFAINERVISYIHSTFGHVAVVKVGATNVGSIKVVFDDELITNPTPAKTTLHKTYSNIHLDKGAEMGRFEFGSTVILLFEPNQIEWTIEPVPGTTVRMGESLARVIQD